MTVHKLQEFIGLVNSYYCFLPNAAQILQPLNKLPGTTQKGSIKLQWSSQATSAFMAAKEAFAIVQPNNSSFHMFIFSVIFRSVTQMLNRTFCAFSEAFPIADITAKTVTNAFVTSWVAQYGGQFKSHLWQQLLELLRTKRFRQPPTCRTFPSPTKGSPKMPVYSRRMDKFITNAVIRRAHSTQE